jgi:hypothetical protein
MNMLMSTMIVKVPFTWQRTKFIMPGPSKLIFVFTLLKRLLAMVRFFFQKVDTKDNSTDMLTKTAPTIKFNHCLDLINISERGSEEKTRLMIVIFAKVEIC